MADVVRGKKPYPILWIGVVGVVLALLVLVWLVGGGGHRSTDSIALETDPQAVASVSTLPAEEADSTHSSLANKTEGDNESQGVDNASTPGRTALLARPIRGRVLDLRTKEPVPFVDVRLVVGVIEETIATGLDGTFQSTREFASDKLTAIVSDAGHRVQTFVRGKDARADDPWILELPIGPTYPLSIATGVTIQPGAWSARVIESTRNFENAGEIDVDDRGLRMSAPIADVEDRAWPWVALRAEAIFADDIPWIRYPVIEFKPDPRYRLRLQLRCESIGRRGQGRIHATVGVQEPVIVDGLKEVGCLTGQIVDAKNAAVSGATVLLTWQGGGQPPQWEVTQTAGKGEFRFTDLPPGSHDLVAFAPQQPVLVFRGLKVTAGVTVLEESLRFPPRSIAIDPDESMDVVIHPEKKDSASTARLKGREVFYAHIRLPEAGRLVRDWVQFVTDQSLLNRDARLQAARLPAADLDVEWPDLLDSRSYVRPPIVPTHLSLSDPGANLRMEYGGSEGRGLHFEIEGEAENASFVDVSFEPGGAIIGEQVSSELRRWSVARGVELRWVAWRRGFAPAFGYADAFKEVKRREFSTRIRFDRGWGAVLWCRATDGMPAEKQRVVQGLGYSGDDSNAIPPLHEVLASPPLPGVRVLVDGVMAGTSDGEGVLCLRQNSLPARLLIVADGWRMLRLERLPQHCGATQRYIVWMTRD